MSGAGHDHPRGERNMNRRLMTTFLCASSVLALASVAPRAQTNDLPLRLRAWAVNMSNISTGANSTEDIVIDRWSTEEERQKLIATFLEKGPEKLLDALQDTKRIGYIRLPNSIGYDLHFARRFPLPDGGERFIIATD